MNHDLSKHLYLSPLLCNRWETSSEALVVSCPSEGLVDSLFRENESHIVVFSVLGFISPCTNDSVLCDCR